MSRDQPHPHLRARFAATFGGAPECMVFAPGRINLIGDHIDYCGGTVLPMTINRGTFVAARRATHGRVRARSDNYHGTFDAPLSCAVETAAATPWARYLIGVLQLLAQEGIAVKDGLELFITSDLPTGGLSSSAALCVGLAIAIETLAGREPHGGRPALARLCQRVEHEYAAVQCGIMDQAVIALSREGHALALDCRDLQHEHIPVPSTSPCWLVLDSGRPRALADAPYNSRQAEALAAQEQLRAAGPLGALCELGSAEFEARSRHPDVHLDEVQLRRARHCVSEQARVRSAISALRAQDWSGLGRAMQASHASLRDDFEVSCAELDALVDAACAAAGVYGARLTGAGFGGAAIALVERDAVASAMAAVAAHFAASFERTPAMFIVAPGGVARVLLAAL